MGSVSQWIGQARRGRDSAVSRLWARYGSEMHRFAAQRLRGTEATCEDQEDIVLETYTSCIRAIRKTGTRANQDLRSRTDFWKYVCVSIRSRVIDFQRRLLRRRDGNSGGSPLEVPEADIPGVLLTAADSQVDDPSISAAGEDEVRRLYSALKPELVKIAEMRVMGYTNPEIAAEFECSLKTIERRLVLIRRIWGNLLNDDETEPKADAE